MSYTDVDNIIRSGYELWLGLFVALRCPTVSCCARGVYSWMFLWLINTEQTDRSAGYHGKSPMELTFHERNEVGAFAACCTSFCEKAGRLKCWHFSNRPNCEVWLWPQLCIQTWFPKCKGLMCRIWPGIFLQPDAKSDKSVTMQRVCEGMPYFVISSDSPRFLSSLHPDERHA